MQCYEISVGLVLKMKSTGPPASLSTSLHGATIMFMGLKEKKSEGRRGVKHMKKLRRKWGGFSLPHRTKGKGQGRRLGHSTFQHSLRPGPTKFQKNLRVGDFSHRMRDSSSLLQSKYTKGNRKILSRHILKQTRAQRPVIFDISFFYLYTVQIAF